MFQSTTDFWRKQAGMADSDRNGMPLILKLSGATEGTLVPATTVVTALLWQQYGLDMLHPEVSRWLEKHAPDVKYAVARNKSASVDERNSPNFRVGRNGTLKVHLSLEIDDRLRKVSSDYFWWQVESSKESEKGQIGTMARLLNNYTASESNDSYFAYHY
jgi:hypothetical protein